MSEQNQNTKKHSFNVLDYIDMQISRFEGFMLAFGVILMAVNTISGAVSRFVFNDSIIYTDELNMFFIILVTFAGISYAARHGRHIRMSAIYDALPHMLRKILMVIMSTVTATFMFFLCYFSVVYISDIYNSGRILPALEIPAFIVYLWVPVGFFVTGIQYTLTVFKNLRFKDVYLSTDVLDGYCDINKDIEV